MSAARPADLEARIRAEVELAVAPYVGVAPPAMLAKMRVLAERYYREHPEAARAIQLQEHAQQLRSGDVALSPEDMDAPAAAGAEKG